MNYEIKDNPVHGKLLAKNGKVVMLPHDQAMALADRFNGTLVKTVTGASMIQLPQSANSIAECDCQQSGMVPDVIDFRMGQGRDNQPDHEVRMARQELYRTAKLAMMTHELLKQVSERQGIEGWVASKLTRAADYIETVFDYLDYEMRYPSEMMEAPIQPVQPTTPGATPGQTQQPQQQTQVVNKVPGMVKMAKVDTNGKIQGQPIMVPGTQVAGKQAAGYHVIGESASGGASGAGGMASSMGFGNGFLNGGPGAISRRPKKKRTTEAWDMLDPSKPYGLANPRILTVGDDPQGIADFAITGKNVLGIRPFNANQWNNTQQDARNHGYMLKYTGTNSEKAVVANSGDAPRLGRNMRGDKLEGVAEGEQSNDPADKFARDAYGHRAPAVKKTKDGKYHAVNADGEHKIFNTEAAAKKHASKPNREVKEGGETGPKFTGYWKGTDKGKPGKKMVGSD
jgi:hypothetical protein